jgi:dTDP-glucose pyrophosphorylase/predicted transcriptional regulator
MPQTNYQQIQIRPEDSLRHAIEAIDVARVQIALVTDETGRLLGTVTDGDIRRGMLRGVSLNDPASEVMNDKPVTSAADASRAQILELMSSRFIKQVPLVDSENHVVGLVLIDDLIQTYKMKENPVIVLAGGQGSRLRPLTDDMPKPLLKIGGRPVLDLILQQLRGHGFHNIYVSINYLGDRIEEHLGNGAKFGMSVHYLKESMPLGTAGPLALLPAMEMMPCLVVNGDLLTKVNFEQMLRFHQDGGYQATIGVKTYSFQVPYGVIVTDNERVVEFHEKPDETRLVNGGVYVLEPKVVAMVPRETYYDMNQLIQSVIDLPDHQVGAFPIHEYWMDIGTAADYEQAQWDYPVQFGQ